MAKRQKESAHRTKLKEQRLMRLKAKHKQSNKKRENEELFNILTVDSIEKWNAAEKIQTMTSLYNLILSFPQSNSDKLGLLMLFMKDNSINIIIKAVKFLRNIYTEWLPSYRWNDTAKTNSKQKESKDIEALHTYERNLCNSYTEYIDNISLLDKTFYKNSTCKQLRIVGIECIAKLFEKYYYFNNEDKLFRILIDKLSDEVKEIKEIAFLSLYNVWGIFNNSQQMFNLKLAVIKRLANSVFSKDHRRFETKVWDLFTSHRIEIPDISLKAENENKIDLSDLKYGGKLVTEGQTKAEISKIKKDMREFAKEKSKIVKSMRKEINEIESKDNPRTIYFMNLKILKKILIVYFDILKFKKNSPLICGVFTGVSKLCENINVEILLDWQKCIYTIIKSLVSTNNFSTAIAGLKANLSITEKLTKEIVSIQDSYLITSVYQIICNIPKIKINNDAIINKEDLSTIFEVIEAILLKTRMFSTDTSASFIKRLCILAECFNKEKEDNIAIAILLLVKRVLSKYSNLSFLIEKDEEELDNFNYKNTTEPELCNGKWTTVLPELERIGNNVNFTKNKMVKRVVDYIVKAQKVNIELSSINYYDILYK